MIARSTLTLAVALALAAAPAEAAEHDAFYWLGQFNKASLVMTVEQGIVPPTLAGPIAGAVRDVIAAGDAPGGKHPADYLQLEPLLIAVAGPDVTRMHSGRSRQDILATTRREMMRERTLALFDALAGVRADLQEQAERHRDAIIPAYTNGVQAQPTTFGHVMLAFDAALARDAERIRQAWARLDQSPLGSAALGTSSFPVDRARLAALLGFAGVADNSYDANQLAPFDTEAEMALIGSMVATIAGQFAEDVHTQYAQPHPWMMLQEGRLTGPSSIMPQKRNPYGLNVMRLQASEAVGLAVAYLFEAHNVTTGMPDYKREGAERAVAAASGAAHRWSDVLGGLVLDEARAAAEVDADWSTTTELADTLQREADVPFRLGHHFASDLVTWGRAHDATPNTVPYAEAQRIYAAAARATGQTQTDLPLDEARFKTVLGARNMVNAARGTGGPQPAELARMLMAAKASLAADRDWLRDRRDAQGKADAALDAAFAKLLP